MLSSLPNSTFLFRMIKLNGVVPFAEYKGGSLSTFDMAVAVYLVGGKFSDGNKPFASDV